MLHLLLQGIDNRKKWEPLEVGVTGANPADTMLTHQHGDVQVVEQVSAYIRHCRRIEDQHLFLFHCPVKGFAAVDIDPESSASPSRQRRQSSGLPVSGPLSDKDVPNMVSS